MCTAGGGDRPLTGGSLHCTAVRPFRKFLPSWASNWFRWVLGQNTVSKPALNSKRLLNSAVCRSNLALLSSLPGAGWAQRSLVLQQQSQSVWNLITESWADTLQGRCYTPIPQARHPSSPQILLKEFLTAAEVWQMYFSKYFCVSPFSLKFYAKLPVVRVISLPWHF